MQTKMLPIVLIVLSFFIFADAQGCNGPLGFESGQIKDIQITASSFKSGHEPYLARLNEQRDAGAWCSRDESADKDPWIKTTFTERKKITQIAVQGRDSVYSGWYVKKYSVGFEKNGRFHFLPNVFDGPSSKNDIAYEKVNFETNSIVIKPISWYPYDLSRNISRVCLRMEVYGCKAPPNFCQAKACEYSCKNTPTEAICECPPGFRVQRNGTCAEIDECAERTDLCIKSTTVCRNRVGFYECECKYPGLEKTYGSPYVCTDINECKRNNGGCNHMCFNTYMSYKCSCYKGYHLDSNNHTCVDDNECANGQHSCDLQTTVCRNTPGDYTCDCLSGLEKTSANGFSCKDINECLVNNGGCEGTCTNSLRSYNCSCPPRTFLHPDGHKCNDIDECAAKTNDCEQICSNHYGGYTCSCKEGFRLNKDLKTCSDINECLESSDGKGSCAYTCRNTIGSFECFCPSGYELRSDQRSCIDINECAQRIDKCDHGTSYCINTHGSYQCRCNPGYKNNTAGQCTANKCPPLKSAKDGYLLPSDCSQVDSKTYKDVCTFKCNAGYEPNDASVKTAFCNADGNWDLRGGFQALCQRIRCSNLTEIPGGSLVPSACSKTGVQYGERCEVYCNNDYYVTGRNSINCQIDGTYDGDFKNTKCMKRERVECPSDLNFILPIGASETTLPLILLDKKLDVTKYITSPPGVLTGQYKFSSKVTSQAVKLMLKDYPQEACTFYVKVEDREPPSFTNCPDENIFVSLSDSNMNVVWPEPKFTDNVGVSKVIQNMKPNHVLPQQVYYVFYAARDEFGNEATCRFFVHVKVRACSKANVPGGERGTMIWFGGGNQLSLFLQCQQSMTTFSANVSTAPIFLCSNGVWQSVPDCVGYSDKNGSCPEGQVTVYSKILTTEKCANCPKGTKWTTAGCEKCPIGTYQDSEGQKSCLPCQTGTTSVETGLKSVSGCLAQCTPGVYSANGFYGSTGCERCPEGSYQDLYGQRSCKLCPEGGKSDLGSKSEDECYLPARISSILPSQEVITAKTGDTVVIKCYGTGNPAPFMLIQSVKPLPPDSFRGKSLLTPLVVANKYISGIQLTITNVQAHYDSQVYKCTADNKRGIRGNLDEREIIINVEYLKHF